MKNIFATIAITALMTNIVPVIATSEVIEADTELIKRAPKVNQGAKVTMPSRPIKETIIQQVSYTGTDWEQQCHIWATEAGVTLNRFAIELIDRESNCNPTIWNMEGSGAYGIAQALPASKLPNGTLTTPQDQIKWMESYVVSRYGSWQSAVAFHDKNNWY